MKLESPPDGSQFGDSIPTDRRQTSINSTYRIRSTCNTLSHVSSISSPSRRSAELRISPRPPRKVTAGSVRLARSALAAAECCEIGVETLNPVTRTVLDLAN